MVFCLGSTGLKRGLIRHPTPWKLPRQTLSTVLFFPHHATMLSSSTIAFPKLIWLPRLPFSLSPSKLPTSVRYCGFYLGKLLCPIIQIPLCLRNGMSGVQELFRTSSSLHGASLGIGSWDSLRSMGPDFWDPVPVIMEGRWGHRPWYTLEHPWGCSNLCFPSHDPYGSWETENNHHVVHPNPPTISG